MSGREHYDPRVLRTSLEGRARALDQLAGFIDSQPAFAPRARERRTWLAGIARREASRCRNDLRMALYDPDEVGGFLT